MKRLRAHTELTRTLLVCLSLAPACLLIILILRYGVDVPVWDEWEYVAFFEEFSRGTLTLGHLFAQQNEYRQFFPNLIFLGLGWLTRWNLRYEMLVSFALACLVSFNVYRLGRETVGGSPVRRLLLYALANLLIFSPVQYDNWLQGMQLIYFMPVACITTCLVIAYSHLGARAKFACCMCLAAVSTFSAANGILCWFVVLPVLLAASSSSRSELWKKRWLVSAWVGGFLLSAALYFNGYESPPHHPGLFASLREPLTASLYFLVLLGKGLELGGMISLQNPTGTKQIIATAAAGLTLLTLYCVALLYLRRDSKLVRPTMGWLMLGAYSLMTAALITLGRAGFGIEQAFAPRYTTLTMYLTVALLYLLPVVVGGRATEAGAVRAGKKRLLLALLGVLLLVSHLFAYAIGIRQMSALSVRFSQGKACLLFIDIVRADCLTKTGYPDVEKLRRAANALDALGFLRPRLIRSERVQDIAVADGGAAQGREARAAGFFESVVETGEGVYTASGWAIAPESGEPADAVLLTYERASADSVVFTLGDTGEERAVVARILGDASPASYARWQQSFTVPDLPAHPVVINAWSFDADTGKAVLLDGTHVIPNPKAALNRK